MNRATTSPAVAGRARRCAGKSSGPVQSLHRNESGRRPHRVGSTATASTASTAYTASTFTATATAASTVTASTASTAFTGGKSLQIPPFMNGTNSPTQSRHSGRQAAAPDDEAAEAAAVEAAAAMDAAASETRPRLAAAVAAPPGPAVVLPSSGSGALLRALAETLALAPPGAGVASPDRRRTNVRPDLQSLPGPPTRIIDPPSVSRTISHTHHVDDLGAVWTVECRRRAGRRRSRSFLGRPQVQ